MGSMTTQAVWPPNVRVEEFYVQVMKSFDGGVFVTDAAGKILLVLGDSDYFLGEPPTYFDGKTIYDLLRDGILSCSTTLEVLRTGRPTMQCMKSRAGVQRFVMSRPVFGVRGEIEFVVSYTMSETTLADIQRKWAEQKRGGDLSADRGGAPPLEKPVIIAESAAMRSILLLLGRIAPTDSTILLLGESGTGKEVLARYIHRESPRKSGPFIPVNCAAVPAELMESEFFGYERGAFTGARQNGKPGLFELAEGGTIFLDEIGEMPLPLQTKLLRVLESGEFRRIGGSKTIASNARVVAATNGNLHERVAAKQFREDLYFRLSVLPIEIPALRVRKEDILPLAEHFLAECNVRHHTEKQLTDTARQTLLSYQWPGNVRELRNAVERMILMEAAQVPSAVLPPPAQPAAGSGEYRPPTLGRHGLREATRQFERSYIQAALDANSGNVSGAARLLQVPLSTLYQKLKEKGI